MLNVSIRVTLLVKKTIPVIFQPTLDLSLELTLTENLVTLNPSKSRLIKIPVFNPTAKNIFIRSDSLIGNSERVATAIPLELKPIEIPADVSKIEVNIEAPKNETKWLPGADLSHLPEDQQVREENLLLDECDVFSKNDSGIGKIEIFKLKLNVRDPKLVWKPYRTIPRQLYSEVKQYLEDLITNNLIKTSYLSYASPMVCVRKKDRSMRLCIDYMELNKIIIPDGMSIPRKQDVLENLGGHKYFSTLDMSKAYHQGFMHENSQHLTVFTSPWGLYEWLRIPFGLSTAPPTF